MKVARATGAAAIDLTIAPGGRFQIENIRVHLSAAGTAGDLTVTVDSGTAAAYDTVLLTQDMSSITNLNYIFTHPVKLEAGDEIDIAWANGSTRTYGIEVVYSLI